MHRGLLVAAAVSALLMAACDTDSGVVTTGQVGTGDLDTTTTFFGTTTTGVDDTTTTVEPTTTAESTTTIPPSTEPPVTDSSPPDTEPEGPVGTPIDGSGTEWHAGAEEGDPEALTTDTTDCATFFAALAAGPYVESECGEWNALGGVRVWTITQGASGRWVAVIWQEHAPGAWVPMLRLIEDEPGTWDEVNIVTGNIDTGPNDELVAGIRNAGSGRFLTVEIVDIRSSNPRVVARVPDLHKGVAQLRPDGVYVYNADTESPECCPAFWDQFLMASTEDGWVLVEGAAGIEPDSVPPSDL